MEAIILAGGLGTRLRSEVSDVPKPLAPINGRPFVAWLLDALAAQGLRKVVMATGYLGHRVVEVLGHAWNGLDLVYSQEPEPLGTGGAVALAAKHVVGDAFFVLNGDTWLALDYGAFDRCARDAGTPICMALAAVDDVSRYGAVSVDQGRVTGFSEKGGRGPGRINAGVYRIDCASLTGWPATPRFSFESEVLMPAAARGQVGGYLETRDFIDIGVPDDYRRAARVLPPAGASA